MVSQLVNSSISRSREGEMRVQATGDGDNVTIFGRGRQRVGPSASVGAADIICCGRKRRRRPRRFMGCARDRAKPSFYKEGWGWIGRGAGRVEGRTTA